MLMSLFFLSILIFFLKSSSVILSLILIEVISFLLLLLVSLNLTFVGPYIYLILFCLFVLLAVTGVLIYFSFTRFYGRDYLSTTFMTQ